MLQVLYPKKRASPQVTSKVRFKNARLILSLTTLDEKNGLTRIAKAIGKEIDFQKELASSDECKTVEQVLSSHQRLIKDHNIQVCFSPPPTTQLS